MRRTNHEIYHSLFLIAAIVYFFTITYSKDSPTESEKENVFIVEIWQNTHPAYDLEKGIRFTETDYYYETFEKTINLSKISFYT